MEDWDLKANAIRKGEKQSMLSLLEERGYVNQIIGFVQRAWTLQWRTADEGSVHEKTLITCLRNEELAHTVESILLLHHSMLATWSRSWRLDGFTFMDIHLHFW